MINPDNERSVPMLDRFPFSLLTLVLAASFAIGTVAHAEVSGDPPEATLKKMIEAAKTKSYDEFMAETDETLRAALTKQQFDAVCNLYVPRLKSGYKTTYLGKLRQRGHVVFLWKLELADGKDDNLVKMAVKDGKVSGFWFQ